MWESINQNAERVGINLILVDVLGGRIHAWIPAPAIAQLENHLIEGEIYDLRTFVVRPYPAMQIGICFRNEFFIQLNHMNQLFVSEGSNFIPPHVFAFTELSNLMEVATEPKFLIDVVGVLQRVQPMTSFTNKRHQQKSCIRFSITDMFTSREVSFYDKLAELFEQGLRDATQHPIIVIISSCKAQRFRGELELTNLPATRFFINLDTEAVHDLRDAFRLANSQT
ncbi:hypothetical protein DCAR_0623356 [Daucus carota subsp. sativus]|uniref:Uncharacterized protein n=1 Tax=Daucus carota subsp. sativus TaxID=79200 RepID=A0A161ZTI6_DAUCS|nr:hypothetical protein DCAR_0623356 [Daucus carota subsp. sativus]